MKLVTFLILTYALMSLYNLKKCGLGQWVTIKIIDSFDECQVKVTLIEFNEAQVLPPHIDVSMSN